MKVNAGDVYRSKRGTHWYDRENLPLQFVPEGTEVRVSDYDGTSVGFDIIDGDSSYIIQDHMKVLERSFFDNFSPVPVG